jgi:aryl-alcohol dehydrogenase-like predicted oxidoreductase
MMQECQEHGSLAANQVGYNLFDRRMESQVLPYCLEQNVGFMAYGTLCYGLLTGAFTPETTFVETDWRSRGKAFGLPLFEREPFLKELQVVQGLQDIAARYDKSVAQLSIAWVVGHPAVSIALVGVRNERELKENVQAVDWALSDEIRAEIDDVFQRAGVPTYVDAEQAV